MSHFKGSRTTPRQSIVSISFGRHNTVVPLALTSSMFVDMPADSEKTQPFYEKPSLHNCYIPQRKHTRPLKHIPPFTPAVQCFRPLQRLLHETLSRYTYQLKCDRGVNYANSYTDICKEASPCTDMQEFEMSSCLESQQSAFTEFQCCHCLGRCSFRSDVSQLCPRN